MFRFRKIVLLVFFGGLILINAMSAGLICINRRNQAASLAKIVRNDVIIGDYRTVASTIRLSMDGFNRIELKAPDGNILFSIPSYNGSSLIRLSFDEPISVDNNKRNASNLLVFHFNPLRYVSILTVIWIVLCALQWILALALRKQIEAQYQKKMEEQRLIQLGTITRQISHDLRSPLSLLNIVGRTTKWPKPELGRSYNKALTTIEDTLDRALNFSIDKSDRQIVYAMDHLVRESVELKQMEFSNRQDVNISLDMKSKSTAKVDRIEFNSLISNILNNSVEARRLEVVEVRILLCNIGEHILIEIQDNGLGMDRKHLKKILKGRFTSKIFGHGLGLESARYKLNEWGGRLEIKSMSDQGTTVRIFLPIAD